LTGLVFLPILMKKIPALLNYGYGFNKIKQERVAELMSMQEQISLELNRQKIGKTFKTVIDRKENEYFIGRTEFDSPEIDNEVLIPVSGMI